MKTFLEQIEKRPLLFVLLICLLSLLLHGQYLNLDIQGGHSWRQSLTMWNINNFVRYDFNILNPRVAQFNGPYPENFNRYEFPIMQWLIALVMKLTTEHIAIMRIMMFAFCSIGIFAFYRLAHFFLADKLSSIATTVVFAFSPLVYYYGINPMPDVFALSMSIVYLNLILRYFDNKKMSYLLSAAIALLLATWAKLPFLMFSIVSIVYFFSDIYKSKSLSISNFLHATIQLVFLIPAFLWYRWVMPTWTGNSIVRGILDFDMNWVDFRDTVIYHIFDLLPMSQLYPVIWIPFVMGLVVVRDRKKIRWLLPIFLICMVYFIFEFNAMARSHDYYMMPFLPLYYLLTGFGIKYLLTGSNKLYRNMMYALLVCAPIYAFWTNKNSWSIERVWFNQDVLIHRDDLRSAVDRDELCIILNDYSNFIFPYQIDKRGHVFDNDNLPQGYIKDMINRLGVTHMYSDSRIIDQDSSYQVFFDSLLMVRGSVHVYKLISKEKVIELVNNGELNY